MDFDDLIISFDGTHHLYEGRLIYEQRFIVVGQFCFPGLAVVCDASGAYHINLLGEAVYAERYSWTGSFAEGVAAVCNTDGRYLYINEEGKPIAFETYLYATEFAEGSAVVYQERLGATHITTAGEPLYGDWYFDARPFAGGRAKVRDEQGWLFISPDGRMLERTDEPSEKFPIQGSVRCLPPKNPIPAALKAADWDAAAVLLRHGERQPLTKGEPGSEKVLTSRGKRQSWAFGVALPKVPLQVYASSVRRCVQTGGEIRAGAGIFGTTKTSPMLGDPGAFVADDDMVRAFYAGNPVKTPSLRYAAGETLPGHYPVRIGTRRMFDFVAETLADEEISVCVTHDVWLVPFISVLTGYDFTDDWPGFLDGCILMRRTQKYFLWWRGEEYAVTPPGE
ncbi:MAG: histidine phosphatase family protein [Methanocalculaceae archaeon]|jgi:broad specificity phosphatase PhoE|nr:histidine phosphatase family protein [Methanocalculaceae archaeon]